MVWPSPPWGGGAHCRGGGLEEKCRSRGVGHTGGSSANSNISENLNLYSNRLKSVDQGVGGPEAIFLVSVSL
jgi:hypothetical protein